MPLRVMDACGIEKIVNITMKIGDAALGISTSFNEPIRNALPRLDG